MLEFCRVSLVIFRIRRQIKEQAISKVLNQDFAVSIALEQHTMLLL